MIRVRLFLLIVAVCFAGESSPLVERAKRKANGGTILCYDDYDDRFIKTKNVTGGNCGYEYNTRSNKCIEGRPWPRTYADLQEKLKFSKIESDGNTFLSVQCKCDGEKCNAKEKFPDCLRKAIESVGSIDRANLSEAELVQIVRCAMNNKSLTYKELFEPQTTPTTKRTTTSTSTEMTATTGANNISGSIDTQTLAIVIIAFLLVAVGVGVVMFCIGKRVGKNSKSAQGKVVENGEKVKPKLGKSMDTVTTPTNISGTPMQSTVSHAKTSEDEFGLKMTTAEASADRSSARTMDRSVVKTRARGSSVKSSAKSVIKSAASMRTEGRSVGKKSAKGKATAKGAKTEPCGAGLSRKMTSDEASADRSSARTMDDSVDKTNARESTEKSNARSVIKSTASMSTIDE